MWVSRSIGSTPAERPDPNTGWTVTPPTYGVAIAVRITAPISPSLTPLVAVIVRVMKTPAAESRSMARCLKRRMSAPRWNAEDSADSPSYCR